MLLQPIDIFVYAWLFIAVLCTAYVAWDQFSGNPEPPNYFTINGKAYPATDTVKLKIGSTIKIRFIGSHSNFVHPMHIHGGPFEIIARDGNTLPEDQRIIADTIDVAPGQLLARMERLFLVFR